MLVISRKTGEEIQIGDSIKITVVNIERGVVRIGIEAPKDINIIRTEIKQAQHEKNPTNQDEDLDNE